MATFGGVADHVVCRLLGKYVLVMDKNYLEALGSALQGSEVGTLRAALKALDEAHIDAEVLTLDEP